MYVRMENSHYTLKNFPNVGGYKVINVREEELLPHQEEVQYIPQPSPSRCYFNVQTPKHCRRTFS